MSNSRGGSTLFLLDLDLDLEGDTLLLDYLEVVNTRLQQEAQRASLLVQRVGGTATVPDTLDALQRSWLGERLLFLVAYVEAEVPSTDDHEQARRFLTDLLVYLYGRPRPPREEIDSKSLSPIMQLVNAVRIKPLSNREVFNINEALRFLKDHGAVMQLPTFYRLLDQEFLWPILVGGQKRYVLDELKYVAETYESHPRDK